MSHAVKYEFLSFDTYLNGEQEASLRHEYVDGQVYSMSGASAAHNLIAGELFAAFHAHTELPCQVFISDMKVVIEQQDKHWAYYPDVMVACDQNEENAYFRKHPLLLVEVLSPSTQRIDLSEKLSNYTLIRSLQEYLIVSQDTAHVQIFRRRTHWKVEYYYSGESFELHTLNLVLNVDSIYRRIRPQVGLA